MFLKWFGVSCRTNALVFKSSHPNPAHRPVGTNNNIPDHGFYCSGVLYALPVLTSFYCLKSNVFNKTNVIWKFESFTSALLLWKKHGIFPCFFPGRQKCTYRYVFYSSVQVHTLGQIKFKTFETLHAEISLAKYIEEIENYNYFLINIFLNILPGCTRFFTFQVFVHIKKCNACIRKTIV